MHYTCIKLFSKSHQNWPPCELDHLTQYDPVGSAVFCKHIFYKCHYLLPNFEITNTHASTLAHTQTHTFTNTGTRTHAHTYAPHAHTETHTSMHMRTSTDAGTHAHIIHTYILSILEVIVTYILYKARLQAS